MKHFYLLVLPAALALAGSGCRKTPAEPAQCGQVSRAPAAFLAYWYFPQGSYWVYQKRGSQPVEVDTVTAIYAQMRVFQPGATTYGLPTCTELYNYTCWHSNRRYFRGTSANSNYRGMEQFETQEEGGQWFVSQSSVDYMYAAEFYWASLLRPLGQPIASAGPVLLDTTAVRVPAGTFPRSVHLQNTALHDSARGPFVRSYHLTRGIGTTRRVYANLGTWELRSYYIAPK